MLRDAQRYSLRWSAAWVKAHCLSAHASSAVAVCWIMTWQLGAEDRVNNGEASSMG